jgi:hypothetical protein
MIKAFLFFLLLPAAAFAGTVAEEVTAMKAPPQEDSGWRFRVAPYLWLTSVSGTVGAGPLSADTDIGARDALSKLTLGAMILSEIGYHRWSLENDVIFAQFQTSKETPGPVFGALNSTLNQFQWTSLVGYRVLEMKRSTFDLQAGFRMMSLGLDLELTPGLLQGASRSFLRTWIDPVIGFRYRAHLTDWLFVIGRGDIGGFGANSELTWQVFAGVGAQMSRWGALIAGYRAIGYEYNQAGFSYDVTTYGPVVGFECRF